MMIRKSFSIVLLTVLAEIIVACCDCPDSKEFPYYFCELELQHLDNSYKEPQLSSQDTINKNAYGMKLTVHREVKVCEVKRAPLFSSAAYATSCDCPPEFLYVQNKMITTISVITINDFDGEHPAGSDISAYLRVKKTTTLETISTFLNNFDESFESTPIPDLEIDLLLMQSPSIGTDHRFKVVMEFSGGKIISAISGKVSLI